ncbi:hypothetical protein V1477_000157 [Vespula maculifrons]|uniref:Uncharacterized protein n=1 Tax=Vespula maculifrons TaxID=7453 RepID=A0ABD2D2W5_VESMC
MLAVHKTNVHRSCLVRRRSIDRQLICLVHDEDDDNDDDDDDDEDDDDETMPFFNNVTQVVRDGDSDRNDGGGVSMQVTTVERMVVETIAVGEPRSTSRLTVRFVYSPLHKFYLLL